MTVLLPAIIPVAFIILIGFIGARALSLENKTLSQLTLYILAPALVADSLYRTTLSIQTSVGLVASFLITSLLLYLLAWGLGKICKLPEPSQKSLITSTLFPNNGNLGLPVSAFVFNTPGLERAVVYMITSCLLMFGIGPALLKGSGISFGIRLTLKLPLFWAMLGGLSLRLLSVELPLRLDEGIQQLGAAAIPVALIILGMQLASTRFEVGIYEICAASLRLLGGPAIAYIVGKFLQLEGLDLQVLVLQSAMPTAISTIVLVPFGGDAPRLARTVVVSTLMSFVTLPLVLWVLVSS
ncbi:MAG: AEC family transporter [Symploca sp. SIO2C1]|nr:AEC family transporter [Symploca sp. SIO2C1]